MRALNSVLWEEYIAENPEFLPVLTAASRLQKLFDQLSPPARQPNSGAFDAALLRPLSKIKTAHVLRRKTGVATVLPGSGEEPKL